MTTPNLITIQILDLPGGGSVCACGAPVDGPEYLSAIQQKVGELRAALEESYPGRTSVEYIDLRQSPAAKETEAGQLLVTKKYPSPLVLIGEAPKFAGSILVKRIVKEVGNVMSSS